jgi:hypothetical protein
MNDEAQRIFNLAGAIISASENLTPERALRIARYIVQSVEEIEALALRKEQDAAK